MAPFFETWICVNLPKRDELRLRLVSAFPNASSSGLVITRSAPSSIDDLVVEATSSIFMPPIFVVKLSFLFIR